MPVSKNEMHTQQGNTGAKQPNEAAEGRDLIYPCGEILRQCISFGRSIITTLVKDLQ